MYKKRVWGILLFSIILIVGCSERKEINIKDIKIFKEELENNFDLIKGVDVTFKGAGLTSIFFFSIYLNIYHFGVKLIYI